MKINLIIFIVEYNLNAIKYIFVLLNFILLTSFYIKNKPTLM